MDKCPVCKQTLEQSERGFIDGYAVKCPVHGWIEISDTVNTTRSNEPRDAWERALRKARDRAHRDSDTLAWRRPRILDHDF
jgi:hypothetical protein